jgi:hypothetical protein
MISGGDRAMVSPVAHHHAALEALQEHLEGARAGFAGRGSSSTAPIRP